MILQSQNNSTSAMRTTLERTGSGVFFSDPHDLVERLGDRSGLDERRAAAWEHREDFSFDPHVPELEKFFETVIASSVSDR
jgi:hypothetical protein